MGVKGLLITLEGIDGSGKSTAAKHISTQLQEIMPERRLILTAEPTGGEAGKILRARLSSDGPCSSPSRRMEELFLFMADHADHLARLVCPSLEEGAIVISDRYADSTAAYQGVTLQGIVPDPVQWIRSVYAPWNMPPDLTLFFALDPALALKRMRSRQEREKFEQLEFLRSVNENFRRLVALEPGRFVSIDASRDAQDVAAQALKRILKRVQTSL
ncbi:MAG: putative thymidylate kinase [Methanosaeta sp. PtaB.Bin018]|nr:MAG: putative thymidylate kinase [Methanosaeta sp. PtaB.Bin018]